MKYPIPVVRVILEDLEGRILLLKRCGDIGKNLWCLPGGKVDYGQTVQQTCIREIKDEINLELSDLRFLFYQDDLPSSNGEMHCVSFYFSAGYSGEISLNDESSEARWIDLYNLKNYDIAFRNDEAIRRYLSGKKI